MGQPTAWLWGGLGAAPGAGAELEAPVDVDGGLEQPNWVAIALRPPTAATPAAPCRKRRRVTPPPVVVRPVRTSIRRPPCAMCAVPAEGKAPRQMRPLGIFAVI